VAEHYVHDQLPADGGFFTSIANLATAASADLETVATLTKTIATLADQLTVKEVWAKANDAEIRCLLGGRAPVMAPAAVAVTPDAAYNRKSYNTRNDKLMLVTWLPGWSCSHKCKLQQESSRS
jgi:hypothetical protein